MIERPHNPRLPEETLEHLRSIGSANGFEPVVLEKLSFEDQMALFAESDQVVAPHGAGLTGLLFGSPELRVLELNTEMDLPGHVRPWFFMLSQGAGQTYRYLNGSRGDFSPERIEEAITRMSL